ncbi:PIN domain-containing protein [Parasulfuritortus cantonensis]|uniref:PIN domain-containing protein n=1 Tax=Parasulfuritortus cantonensis TaxID=2528202 RepID=A0A4R1BMX8_9PROT|nr:PIN domain-containing protein [Parasulfuritortus cantonensis]TCJ18716.1 PIN domain-containing protein [Parasulfuritortus cantonensis]
MVVFDAGVLIDLFHPRTHPDRKAKLEHLIADLQRKKIKIVIPTPALSEFLARAGKARDDYYARLSGSSAFKIVAFDSRASLECALLLDAALTSGDKRHQAKTWAKAKFDWQIVAIAKVANARTVYSDDGDVARIGQRYGLAVIKTDDLPLPDAARQTELDLPE